MDNFIQVAKTEEVKERFATSVKAGIHKIALFRYKGRIYALRDSCPHQGAPISEGYVEGEYAVCPHHGWKFKLADGSFAHNELIKIKTYPVKESEGFIFVKLS
jgi:NAD(P)H-dependent nitrite reductase small subunit